MIGDNMSILTEEASLNKNVNKKVKELFNKMLKQISMNKVAKIKPSEELKLAPGMKYIKPEQLKKELNNFEVIDTGNRAILVPFGVNLDEQNIALLQQIIRANPQLLIIRQKGDIVDYKKDNFNQVYPSGLD